MMDLKLCRICRQSGHDFIHIFKTTGLKNKIETCLPIIVSPHCLLPDTLCPECLKAIENFYVFLKNCLQNIIILESQLDIQESCLKTKRRKDKSCYVALPLSRENKSVQTEDYLDVLLGTKLDFKGCKEDFPLTSNFLNENVEQYKCNNVLVDYEVHSDSNSNEYDTGLTSAQVIFGEKLRIQNNFNNLVENILCRNDSHRAEVTEQTLISEISERKNLKKRKSECIENSSTKICRFDSGNKRKCSKPKKVEKTCEISEKDSKVHGIKTEVDPDDFQGHVHEIKTEVNTDDDFEDHRDGDCDMLNEEAVRGKQTANLSILYETCLLCNLAFEGTSNLAEHFVTVHAREFPQRNSVEFLKGSTEKKKRNLPSLVKISDLRRSDSVDDAQILEESHTLPSRVTCPNCPASFITKSELFIHLQLRHSEISTYLCGMCLRQVNSFANLKSHVQICSKTIPVLNRYYCKVCYFGEDSYKSLETHVLVHGFLLEICRKEIKNFDPEDFIQKNPNFEVNGASPLKNFSCLECNRSDFDSFRKFSIHRRNIHSIYHCDLCNKFYGRNSHLWKHVHRLHKGHPSITCQLCLKTSASKYHLAQHFSKIHQLKSVVLDEDQNGIQKLSQIVDNAKASVNKQDSTTDPEHQNSSLDGSFIEYSQSENDNSLDVKIAPKEIDPSHDLYTNILTNYTPPKNEGDFKCPKCSKGFHKRMLLRKHKKNCRPKLQKDLLTRCKSCARIFKDRQSLAKHLINYHSDYMCEICSEKVPSKCEIVTHIRFQHPSSYLVCSVCENILRCKKDLLDHLADHENSYVCQFCGDTLPSKVKLKMHILSLHRKILSLSCGICLKLFENQVVLRNHVTLIHKDRLDPLTSCPICGKNYGSKWKTFDHVNKSHGRFFKACKICLDIYESESQLEAHIKTVHITQQIPMNSVVRPNPAALLNVPEPGKGCALNLNNNQNEFESDSDDNTEETQNNTRSSESEADEDNSGLEQQEKLKSPTEKNFLTLPCQENKISLLEKRLLGKGVAQSTVAGAGNFQSKQYLIGNGGTAVGVIKKLDSGLLKIKKEEDSWTYDKKSDSNHLIHHSKRTVYVNSNDPSFCEICHKTWPAKKHLWQHYIRCHKRVAATVCGICLKTNKNYESLQTHLREIHPTLLHGQGLGSNFICRICGRYHNASSKLSLHMVIHENFDWTLLDRFPPILKYQPNVKNASKQNGQKRNGNGVQYELVEINETDQAKVDVFSGNDEMYDAMIEQVEESSTSSETDTTTNKPAESSSDSEEDNVNSAPSRDNSCQNKPTPTGEHVLSFSNLLQTLKNHSQFHILNQTHSESLLNAASFSETPSKNIPTAKTDGKFDISKTMSNKSPSPKNLGEIPTENAQYVGRSYLSEESSSSMSDCEQDGDRNSQDDGQDSQDGGQSSVLEDATQESQGSDHSGDEMAVQDGGVSRHLLSFRPKPEELDSAIKSISDTCAAPVIVTNYNDFSEPGQSANCLNDTEIENAVGSIL